MTKQERQQRKEARQLTRLQKIQSTPDYKGYFIVMMGLVILFQVLDMMATGVYGNLQEVIVKDFAGLAYNADISAGGSGYQVYQDTLSKITFISILSFAFMGIVPWYKSLADKVGRKPLFIANAILLGGAMFIGGLTHNLIIFLIVSTVITFFTLHDMQILYVMECVPDNKRGTWTGIIQAVGNAAGLIVISLRLAALQPDGSVGQVPWRGIYVFIGVVGIAVFILSFFFLRESRPFVDSRISYLKKSPAQRKAEQKKTDTAQGGVIAGLKLMFKNKQLRWLAIATLVASTANNMVCSYNTTIMAQNGLDTIAITIGLVSSSAVAVLIGYVMGPISDRIGRKWSSVIFGALGCLTFGAFVFGAPYISSPLANGIFSGICFGLASNSYTNMMALTTLMMSESSPASMRSSIIGVRSFFQVSAVVAMALSGVLFRFMPTGTVCFLLTVPFLAISCVILMLKTKETMGVSMEAIEAEFGQ